MYLLVVLCYNPIMLFSLFSTKPFVLDRGAADVHRSTNQFDSAKMRDKSALTCLLVSRSEPYC